MKKSSLYLLAFGVVVLDQLTKFLAQTFFTSTINTGAAFGLFPGHTLTLSIISAFVVVALIFALQKYPLPELALLIGGTLGNLLDRVFRGYVIDFIAVGWWPSFDLADAASTLAVLFLIFRTWKSQ